MDWLALLKEGEDELEPWDEDDTLSDWSDDEGSQKDCLGPNLDPPGEKDQVKGDQRLQEEVSEGDWFKHQVLAAHDWVATQKEGLKPQASPHSVARLTNKVEGQLEAAGGLGLRTQRTTEYQVISLSGSFHLIDKPDHAGDQRSVVDATVPNQLPSLPAGQRQLENHQCPLLALPHSTSSCLTS